MVRRTSFPPTHRDRLRLVEHRADDVGAQEGQHDVGRDREVDGQGARLLSGYAGMPGGPMTSMPYSAAAAAIASGAGGSTVAGGSSRAPAGTARARMKPAKSPGSATSRYRACGEVT